MEDFILKIKKVVEDVVKFQHNYHKSLLNEKKERLELINLIYIA